MTDTPPPDDERDEPVPEPAAPTPAARPVGRTVRTGCIVLAVVGLLGVVIGGLFAADPEASRCAQARLVLEDEDVTEDASDVPCDEAIDEAAALHESADDEDDVAEVATASQVRTQALVLVAIGVLQAAGGILTARTRAKRARTAALVAAGVGVLFPVPFPLIGPLATMVLLVYAVYAIFFSADARAVFGEPAGPRMFRPRAS